MIKAIETRYAGCRFRSRLEARWAVFLDAYGIKWQYEAEGYETSAGRYLPDFTISPESVTWDDKYLSTGFPTGLVHLEVKGAPLRLDEAERMRAFACTPGSTHFLFALGNIPDPLECMHCISGWGAGGASRAWFNNTGGLSPEAPTNDSNDWGATKPHFMDYAFKTSGCGPVGVPGGLMNRALTAARSARFEHGENG